MQMDQKKIDALLAQALSDVQESRVKEAMTYTLLAPGKRIRPLLLFAILDGYDQAKEKGIALACALEMIHAYSLIHDDLPAMDNDDFRRGRPTCHKRFDEATAILAGDGLLTQAFHIASKAPLPAPELLKCIQVLAEMAGPNGMVYGQCLDMAENASYDWEMLQKVHHCKTGCLLAAPFMIGAILSAQKEEVVQKWKQIGMQTGLAFQIQDDLLDETKSAADLGKSNSDIRNHKVTSVSLCGLANAKKQMQQLYDESYRQIREISSFAPESLFTLMKMIQNRDR